MLGWAKLVSGVISLVNRVLEKLKWDKVHQAGRNEVILQGLEDDEKRRKEAEATAAAVAALSVDDLSNELHDSEATPKK